MNRFHGFDARADNALLREAESQISENEQAADAIQVAAAVVAVIGILVACFFVMSLGL